LAAGAYALGPGAAGLVEVVADGRTVWRLGTLEVEGVRGAWIGDLTAATVRLADDDGVWLEARNARVRWSPGRLMIGRVRIDEAVVPEALILRRPALGAPPRSRGMDLSLSAPSLRVQALRITEAFAGVNAVAAVNASVETDAGALQALLVNAVRVDAATDRAIVRYREETARPWTVEADGAEGGILAGLLGAGTSVSLSGEARTAESGGQGSLTLRAGAASVVEARGSWTEAGWQAQGSFDPGPAPFLLFADRLGGAGRFEAGGGEDDAIWGRLEAPALVASVEGPWDGAMQVSARTERPGVLLGLHYSPAERLAVEGVFRRGDSGGGFEGRAVVEGASGAGFGGRVEGPLAMSFDRERIRASFEASVQGGWQGIAISEAEGSFVYGRQSEELRIERALLIGPAGRAEARGTGERFTGSVRVSDLSRLFEPAQGSAEARFEAVREGEAWRITAEGAGNRVRADDPYGELLGARPRLAFEGVAAGGEVRIGRASLIGARLRLGAQGRASASSIDVVWEASGRGPVSVAGVGLAGAIDVSGRVLGSPSAPRVSGVGELSTLDLGALTLAPAQVRFAYADGTGTVALSGLYGAEPFTATGDVIVGDGSVVVEGLTADFAGLSARGALSVEDGALSGAFDLAGPLLGLTGGGGVITARALASGTGEAPIIEAAGEVAGAAFGPAFVQRGQFSVRGPLRELAVAASADGAVRGRAFDLAVVGAAAVADGGVEARASVEGVAAGLAVTTASPILFRQQEGFREIAGVLSIGGGTADLQWTEEGGGFAVAAEVERLPMAVLAALGGQAADGLVNGRITARSLRGRLVGEADVEARDFRVRGRMRSPIDLRVSGRLADETVTAQLNAWSDDGLRAQVNVSAMVTTQATPLRIAQAEGQAGRATWDAAGPADAFWALAGSADQSLSGSLTGSGEARFGPGALAGSGALALRNGSFEDRVSGARLQDVTLDVRLSDDQVRVEALSATDGAGGRLTGSGALDAARAGSLQVRLDNLRFIDREDVTARADGVLTFGWDEAGGVLSGSLALTEATIRGAPAGNSDIPTLAVVEINRPGGVGVGMQDPAPRAGPPTRLALRVQGPQRVFTRYRGVDAEWALDLSVSGMTSAPELVGEARLLRGEAQLAGRPLEFTRGMVRFRGPPEDAELDIVAEQETPDLTVRVVLAGTIGEPEVSLENDQGLPDDEVLPLLLFGATQAELSPLQAAQLASSLSALTGGAAFDLVDLTRRIAGLDRFDVRQEEDGIFVAGGRYLTREVYVELARNGLGEAQTRVEWLLTPDLTLITSFAEDGEQRVSLRWREETDDGR
jgi:translocation and assembly module TamB